MSNSAHKTPNVMEFTCIKHTVKLTITIIGIKFSYKTVYKCTSHRRLKTVPWKNEEQSNISTFETKRNALSGGGMIRNKLVTTLDNK